MPGVGQGQGLRALGNLVPREDRRAFLPGQGFRVQAQGFGQGAVEQH